MNEHIQELAKKAYTQERLAENPNWKPSPIYECLMKDYQPMFEVFAELIVKECTNTMLHYTDVDEGVAVVKRQFGVE